MTAPTVHPARLLISCDDQTGIVAAVTGFLTARGANIITLDQYSTDASGGRFFMRVSFVGGGDPTELGTVFESSVARRFSMEWSLRPAGSVQRVALLVSRYDHCLLDLLWRWRRDELPMDVTCVVSNHEDLRKDVESIGLPFHLIPVEKGRKPEAEQALIDLIGGPSTSWCSPATCRSSRATSSNASACRSSTSTTPSCPPSPAPALTSGRGSAA